MRRMRRVSRNHSAEYGFAAYSALRELDYQIKQHTVSNDDIQRLALKLCAFYRQAPAAEISPEAYRRQLECWIPSMSWDFWVWNANGWKRVLSTG